MRLKSMFSLFLMLGLCNLGYAQDDTEMESVLMNFEKTFIDFGTIKRGEKREGSFEFTNTGKEDIKIDLVSACECTTTEYPRRPIKPGETAAINFVFDSTEKEKSETVDIDIFLQNINPATGSPYIEMLQFKFELEE